MSDHEWRPLGLRRTLWFFLHSRQSAASWRHFGWELSIERTYGSLDVWIHRLDDDA